MRDPVIMRSGFSSRLKTALAPREPIRRPTYLLLGILSFILVLIIWSALTYSGMIPPLFLPTPTAILRDAVKLFREMNFTTDILATTLRVLVGFAVATLLGVPLGILVGTFKVAEALVEPLVAFIRYMPASAFIPLLILWIGINEVEKVAVIFLGVFFQLVLMVAVAAISVPRELLEVSYTLGTSRSRVLWRVLLPAAMPDIVDSLRLILGWAWTYVIVAELIAASSGIGNTILKSMRMLNTGNIIVGILTIGFLGLIFDYLFKWLHRALFPWTE